MPFPPFSGSEANSERSLSSDLEKDERSNAPLLPYNNDNTTSSGRRHAPWASHRTLLSTTICLLLTNLATLSLLITSHDSHQPSVAEPPHGVPRILSSIPLNPTPKLLNATLYDAHNPYRLRASAEADAAWKDLIAGGDHGVLLVQKGDEVQAGINPAKHVYWDYPEKGLVGYPVALEAVHQLHCLDMVRKHLFYNIEYTRAHYDAEQIEAGEEMRRQHVDHCIDLIRQRLMCTADTGLLPTMWIGKKGRAVADFVTWHTCRNYDAFREFLKENLIPMPKPGEVMPKEGDFTSDDYE